MNFMLHGLFGWPARAWGDLSDALANLYEVFSVIRRVNLWLPPRKCHLLQRETAFLGHLISAEGIATDPSKVAVVRD